MNEPSSADAPKCRVLVVDDHVDAAETMATLLRLLGHDVAVAFDGPTGLDLARRDRPDVALLDLGLPRLSGYEVARAIRADAGCGKTRLIAVSGFGQEADRQKCREAGFDHHLIKPVELADLRPLLKPAE